MDVAMQPAIASPLPFPAAGERPSQPALTGAVEVHRALCLPPETRVGAFEVASRILPQRGIAGDFIVDVPRPGAAMVAIGDLMGKGLAAAMWLTHVIDLLRRAGESGEPLAAMLRRLNAELHSSRVGVPLTSLALFELAEDGSRARFAVAGHPPAVLLPARGGARLLHQGGPLLGALPAAEFEVAQLDLAPGDRLVAFSDGLVEFHDDHGREFGMDGILACLQGHRRRSAAATADQLLECARRFAGRRPADDVSILVLHRH